MKKLGLKLLIPLVVYLRVYGALQEYIPLNQMAVKSCINTIWPLC